MIIRFKNSWKVWSISLFVTLCAAEAFGQSLSDIVVNIDTGQWQHTQSTYIGRNRQDALELNGTHCVTESESNLTVQDYADKLVAGVGQDANCDFSEIRSEAGFIYFDLICSNSADVTTELEVIYRQHSSALITFDSHGTVTALGHSTPLRVEGGTVRLGDCNDEDVAEDDKAVSEVEVVESADLSRYLKDVSSTKPVLVHFSSTDKNCSFCIQSNASFQSAHGALKEQFHLVEVNFDPWQSFTQTYRSLGGIPAVQIYHGIVPVTSVGGYKPDIAGEIKQAYAATEEILNDDYSDLALPQINGGELAAYLGGRKSEKPLLLHLTSANEEACPFCIKNNLFFRAATREFSEKYDFAEMNYQSISEMKTDETLHAYLKEYKSPVGGLPVILYIDSSGRVNQRPGVWPTILDDLKQQ